MLSSCQVRARFEDHRLKSGLLVVTNGFIAIVHVLPCRPTLKIDQFNLNLNIILGQKLSKCLFMARIYLVYYASRIGDLGTTNRSHNS